MLQSLAIGFNAVFPLFIYLLIGQIIVRLLWISKESLGELNRVLFTLFIPINLFRSIYEMDFSKDFHLTTLLLILALQAVVFILCWVVVPRIFKENKQRGVIIQGITRSNTIVFGIPLGAVLLGEANMGMVSIILATMVPINSVLSTFVISAYSDEEFDLANTVQKVLANPLIIGTFLGIITQVFNLSLPMVLFKPLQTMSSMTSPLILIVMGGLFTVSRKSSNINALSFTVMAKLIVVPLFAIIAASLLGFNQIEMVAALLVFASPTALSSYPQAVVGNADIELANGIVVFTTLFSILTLAIWVGVLTSLGLM